MSWICCQLGAREHYVVPRALHRDHLLRLLVTDAWQARDRFHSELSDACVRSFTFSLVSFELLARARGLNGWDKILARNEWFQRKALRHLAGSQLSVVGSQVTVFAYAYAAREILRFAKERGCQTVLGQIDPGPVEEDIVAKEVSHAPDLGPGWQRAPAIYWEHWRQECDLADRIVVNSEWSKACLTQAGVSPEKIAVIPLAYDESEVRGQRTEVGESRDYPDRFTRDRRLRMLFLGQVNVRKGVARLLDAIRRLTNEPVEFQFVGPIQIAIPPDMVKHPNVRWCGAVPRSRVTSFYRDADVLIFPTLSDGFGLTQLEAQSWKLPMIVSRNCGEVVKHEHNGLVLEEPTGETIEGAIRFCLENPVDLAQLSQRSAVEEKFRMKSLRQGLMALQRTDPEAIGV